MIRFLVLCSFIFVSCSKQDSSYAKTENENNSNTSSLNRERVDSLLVSNNIFQISYNEKYEQPNWVKYTVRDIIKNADRAGIQFYTVDSIYTSDDDDYYSNRWDRGHMAPAGSFNDSYEDLYSTFSYINVALQYDDLSGNPIDSNGKIIWDNTFGGKKNDIYGSTLVYSNNSIFISGQRPIKNKFSLNGIINITNKNIKDFVYNKDDIKKTFEEIKKKWAQIDFVVHAIAFSDKSELSGEYLNTTRENFLKSMLISCFSFTEVSKESLKVMNEISDESMINTSPSPSMGSEDFAFMLQEKPGSYIWIGNGDKEGSCMLHNPGYDFNDEILPIGATYWVNIAEEILSPIS